MHDQYGRMVGNQCGRMGISLPWLRAGRELSWLSSEAPAFCISSHWSSSRLLRFNSNTTYSAWIFGGRSYKLWSFFLKVSFSWCFYPKFFKIVCDASVSDDKKWRGNGESRWNYLLQKWDKMEFYSRSWTWCPLKCGVFGSEVCLGGRYLSGLDTSHSQSSWIGQRDPIRPNCICVCSRFSPDPRISRPSYHRPTADLDLLCPPPRWWQHL